MRFAFLTMFAVLIGASSVSAQKIPISDRSREAVEQVEIRLTPELERKGMKWGSEVFVRIIKDESVLEVWIKAGNRFELFKKYPICFFSGGLGPKKRRGDGKTPEGFYSLTAQSFNPYSSYHLSMNTGYPNRYDRFHGRTGSLLMIHGDCVSIGCFAMTNHRIEEIYALVEAAVRGGQSEVPLHIFPFRLQLMTLLRYIRFDSFSFWRELRDGYLHFEEFRTPPRINVVNGRYSIDDE